MYYVHYQTESKTLSLSQSSLFTPLFYQCPSGRTRNESLLNMLNEANPYSYWNRKTIVIDLYWKLWPKSNFIFFLTKWRKRIMIGSSQFCWLVKIQIVPNNQQTISFSCSYRPVGSLHVPWILFFMKKILWHPAFLWSPYSEDNNSPLKRREKYIHFFRKKKTEFFEDKFNNSNSRIFHKPSW